MKALNILIIQLNQKLLKILKVMKIYDFKSYFKKILLIKQVIVYILIHQKIKYGSLSHKASDENSQARVEANNEKKKSIWFCSLEICKTNDVSFEAPFGLGRPGWHIECSAMIEKHLAYKDEVNFK